MPVVNGWNAMFLFQDPAPGSDEQFLGRVVEALASRGFTSTRIGRGSSGMEACVSVSRGRVKVALWCEFAEPQCESQFGLWHHPPFLWRRILRLVPAPNEVEEALAAVREVAARRLASEPAVSAVVWRTTKEHAAYFIQQVRRNANA